MKTLLKNCCIYGKESKDILVENGFILDIGYFRQADQVVDLSEFAAVLPGFIDAHMHLVTGPIEYNDVSLRAWAQAGVTTLRDLGIGNDIHQHPTEEFLAYRETVENPECAHCITCGRFVTQYHGYSHIMPDAETGIGCKTVGDCIRAVNSLIDMGCEGIKTALDRGSARSGDKPLLSLEMLKAIVDTANQRNVWCCAHVLDAALVPTLLDAGIRELAHMPTNHMPDSLLHRMVEENVAVVPTLCTVNEPMIPMPESMPMPPMPKGMTPPSQENKEMQERICLNNVSRFVRMGGTVAVGTDTMRMETRPGSAKMPIRELQLLHKAGLSIPQVIDAATINGAKLLKMDREIGSIQIGKRANIIAVRQPIDDTFAALDHVSFVMNRGVIIRQ